MKDQELADKLAEILFYNELSEKAKNIIDNAYIELKESDERMIATCDNCNNKNTEHCENENKSTYGFCGNWCSCEDKENKNEEH